MTRRRDRRLAATFALAGGLLCAGLVAGACSSSSSPGGLGPSSGGEDASSDSRTTSDTGAPGDGGAHDGSASADGAGDGAARDGSGPIEPVTDAFPDNLVLLDASPPDGYTKDEAGITPVEGGKLPPPIDASGDGF
jgi:hypothetical protein